MISGRPRAAHVFAEIIMYKKTASRMGWALFMMALVTNAAQILAMLVIDALVPSFEQSDWYSVSLVAIGFYMFGLPVFLLMTRSLPEDGRLERAGLERGDIGRLYLMCMFMGYVFSVVGVIISEIVPVFTGVETVNPVETLAETSGMVPMIIISGICSPIIEEIVFRGVLLRRALAWGEKAAVWFTAITFGLLHMNLYQMFYAIAIGVILGHVAVKTGGIKYTVILHIMVNMTSSVVMPVLLYLGDESGSYAGLLMVLMLIWGGVFWFKGRKELCEDRIPPREEEGCLPEGGFDPGYYESIGLDDGAGGILASKRLYLNLGSVSYFILCAAGTIYSLF